MSKLTRKYFGGQYQESKHDERLTEMVVLFVEYSKLPEFELKTGQWLMSRWLFIMPDVLYYMWLKSKGVAIDEPLNALFKPSGTVSRLREIEVIKAELTRASKPTTQKNIIIAWLEKKNTTPSINTLFKFYNTLAKFSSVWQSKMNYEHYFTRQELIDAGKHEQH